MLKLLRTTRKAPLRPISLIELSTHAAEESRAVCKKERRCCQTTAKEKVRYYDFIQTDQSLTYFFVNIFGVDGRNTKATKEMATKEGPGEQRSSEWYSYRRKAKDLIYLFDSLVKVTSPSSCLEMA